MDFILKLLLIAAWFGAVIGLVLTVIVILLNVTYKGSADYWHDIQRGKTRTYLIGRWLVMLVISVIYLIAHYTQ